MLRDNMAAGLRTVWGFGLWLITDIVIPVGFMCLIRFTAHALTTWFGLSEFDAAVTLAAAAYVQFAPTIQRLKRLLGELPELQRGEHG